MNKPLRVLALACAVMLSAPLAAQEAGEEWEANQFRFERQLRVNPFDPAALNNLAVVKAGQGRFDDAQDLLERALRLAPESKEIRTNLGRLNAWTESLGREPRPAPELSISQVPPDPPRLWNATPPKN